ncbi:tetratricopeptide repeat protein [Pedobacter boryungensis]|uniref:Tetratricopeptide repeat protein n=2 Tax=Pedobacter boryungensis TaxID=869962 RepID=A0ABX2DFL1_9SPHI|nr:tetratricopeptide repeat protein [Pedobacter boryungensis]
MKMIKKAITLSLGLVMMGGASFAQSLADAKKAIDAEQYQKASAMLKTLVNSQASKGENYFSLGEVYLRTDDIDSARAIFLKGITAEPKYALNYVGLGHADLKSNNATSAKTNFDKALSFGAKDYLTYLAIGRAYLDQKTPDYAAALPNLQKADELDSKDKDPETFVALGDYYAMQKKNSEAYNIYLRATDINPALYRVNVQIGKMYKEAYAFAEAEAQLKKAVAGDPNYGPAYRELAELYLQWSYQDPKNGEAKRAEASTNMKKYLDLTDKSFDSRLRYAQFLVYAEDFATLSNEVATLNAPDANNPKTFVVIRMRGYSAIENKNYPQGVQFMNELFARKQDTSRILGSDYLYLGKALQGTGNDSLAVLNITKGIELDTTKVEELAEIGKKYYAAKSYDKAIPVFKKVIALNSKNPNMAMNYYYLGLAEYVKSGAKDRALLVESDSALAKVITLAPEYDPAFLYRARINKAIDAIDNPETQKGLAVPFYEKYITLLTVTKPEKAAANVKNLADSYNYLGFYYSGVDKEKAKEYFNKTLSIDPANAYAADNLKLLNAPAAQPKKAPIKK